MFANWSHSRIGFVNVSSDCRHQFLDFLGIFCLEYVFSGLLSIKLGELLLKVRRLLYDVVEVFKCLLVVIIDSIDCIKPVFRLL